MIELSDIPTAAQRTALSDAGITLLDYYYDLTWTASFDALIDPTQINFVVSIRELEPSEKLSPLIEMLDLSLSTDPTENQIDVFVRSWDTTVTENLTLYGTVVSESPTCTIVQITPDDIQSLADHPNTRWIEPVFSTVSLTDEAISATNGSTVLERAKGRVVRPFSVGSIQETDDPVR